MPTRQTLTALRRAIALAAVLFLAAAVPAKAELHLDISKGTVEPLPIAVTQFYGEPVGQQIANVVEADLERSGLFRPLDHRAFIQTPDQLANGLPRYGDWKVINAQALVSGTAAVQPDGRLKVEFRLFDVLAQQQLTGLAYFTQPDGWRRIAHIIADAIYKRVTGEDGYFDTRIVYIAESGPATTRQKRLAIMDQDGENNLYLTDGRVLVLTPRFSPTAQEITYLSYFNNKPRVYIFNVDTGRQEVLGDFPGMTFAPRFSPDGNKVIMSLAQNGNTDIYLLDLRTRRQTRLTDNPAIDTAPSFSPDGSKITFESDRGGSQQIYTMNADGTNVQRITFGAGKYGTPVWSPRGDLIAFTRINGGRFSIGVIRPDGSGERELSTGYLVEGPTWAPNGRVLMYFKEKPVGEGGRQRQVRLYSIDLTGRNERQMLTPTDASDPAWSPLIP
ncbi:Tol-Pal system beta propeller repeat protein TolB [Nitrospirillum iridis]|uniref:Tol-Pal system protein TolB n=1 Tax=Nitrospirillum iridis TaxID=765888 RepID=A0A7X0EAU9_9PROT|nr:Tol-Pal system beta propeller repeat protein TolB [Nitrospirillum iridis]MBB6249942.1 TolB protein [Nitrospirillum iridis]